MGFLDFFLGVGGGGGIKKHARRVANRDAQADDREASVRWLAEQGTPEALEALCERFNLQLEHSMKDRKEKDLVVELLVGHGKAGAAAARSFAMKSVNFPLAVRVIEQVEGAAAAIDILLDMLAKESVHEEFHPEKKRALLIHLAERKDGRIAAAAAPFLADHDEGVRHGALECGINQADEGQPLVLQALSNPKEESTRIRGRAAEVVAQRGWELPAEEWLLTHLPSGFRLQDNRLVAGR